MAVARNRNVQVFRVFLSRNGHDGKDICLVSGSRFSRDARADAYGWNFGAKFPTELLQLQSSPRATVPRRRRRSRRPLRASRRVSQLPATLLFFSSPNDSSPFLTRRVSSTLGNTRRMNRSLGRVATFVRFRAYGNRKRGISADLNVGKSRCRLAMVSRCSTRGSLWCPVTEEGRYPRTRPVREESNDFSLRLCLCLSYLWESASLPDIMLVSIAGRGMKETGIWRK